MGVYPVEGVWVCTAVEGVGGCTLLCSLNVSRNYLLKLECIILCSYWNGIIYATDVIVLLLVVVWLFYVARVVQ